MRDQKGRFIKGNRNAINTEFKFGDKIRLGTHHSDETKQILSEQRKGRKIHTQEHKKVLHEKMMGNKFGILKESIIGICANPICKKEFKKHTTNNIYCCKKCSRTAFVVSGKKKEFDKKYYLNAKVNRKEDFFKQRKNANLKKNFNITLEEFNQMLSNQNNLCMICRTPFNLEHNRKEMERKACVDHNHQTGKVRGLICNNCNTGLGRFKDNIELLREAIKYLEKTGG